MRGATSASIPNGVLLTNGLDEGILPWRPSAHRVAARAFTTRRRSSPSRRSICMPSSTARRRRPDRRTRRRRTRTSASRPTRVLDAITAAHAVIFLTNPNNPDGTADPARGPARISRAGAARARAGRRGLCRLRRTLLRRPELDRACRTCSSAGRSRRATAWRACASARSIGHAGDARRRCGGRAAVQRQRRGRWRPARGARRTPRILRGTAAQAAESRERLYAALPTPGSAVLAERRELRAGARRRQAPRRRGAAAAAIHVRDRSTTRAAPAACGSRRASSTTRSAAHRSAGGGRCAARRVTSTASTDERPKRRSS